MAETKKTTETKTVKSSETKAAAPKATAAKKTTTKTAAPKATAEKTTAKASTTVEVKAETAAVEVAPVKTAETKKTTKKPAGDMIKVTLVKSASGRLEKQTRTLEALGLKKINSFNVVPDNAAIRGMIFVVKHLVKVEKV